MASQAEKNDEDISYCKDESVQKLNGSTLSTQCFKCREKREFTVTSILCNKKLSTNTARAQGNCSVCGTKMSCFVSLKNK